MPPHVGPQPVVALRAPTDADVGWITEACQDPDIGRWTTVPVPYEPEDARVFVASGAGSLAVWAVVDAVTGAGLGMVAIHGINDGDASLGYWVAPWARRRGVAAVATTLAAEAAADLDGVVSVSLDIATTNVASRGVARRAGFTEITTVSGLMVPDGDGESPATRFVRMLH